MRILQVIGTLDPEYGGPPVVVANISRALAAAGHDVDVVSADDPSAPWLGGRRGFGSRAGRFMYSGALAAWLRDHVSGYDAVVVHGIWQFQTRAVRVACDRVAVPFVVLVHGALDPWFGRRFPAKRLKKALYWRAFECVNLASAAEVLFTNDEERRLAASAFPVAGLRCAVMPIGSTDPGPDDRGQHAAFLRTHPELRDRRLVLFLGRLHPKKGCDLLIRAFAQECGHVDSAHLVIAGPDDGIEKDLRSIARELGVEEKVTWTGMLRGDAKWGALRAAEAFVLPSHSENFGIVIAEALACGTPTLISDKVNIWPEILRLDAGLVGADTVEGVANLLREWWSLNASERDAMAARARECFEVAFEEKVVAAQTLETLRRAARAVPA